MRSSTSACAPACTSAASATAPTPTTASTSCSRRSSTTPSTSSSWARASGSRSRRDGRRGRGPRLRPRHPARQGRRLRVARSTPAASTTTTSSSSRSGLNGVGTKAVNALSVRLRGRQLARRQVQAGELRARQEEEREGRQGDRASATAPSIRFTPDPEIFGDYDWREEYIEHRLRYYAYLNSGLTLDYNGKKFTSARTASPICSPTSSATRGRSTSIVHCKRDRLEFAFTHTHAYGENYFCFVNGQYTNDGGTHQSAFREGLLKGVNEFAKKSFAGEDVRDGLVGAVAIKLQDPVFESQTKNKLGSTEVRTLGRAARSRSRSCCWLHQNPEDADKLAREGRGQREGPQGALGDQEGGARARQEGRDPDPQAHRLQGPLRRRQGQAARGDARSSSPRATRPAARWCQARDVQTQAIFSLKGKPLNCHGLEARRDLQERRALQHHARPRHRGRPRRPALQPGRASPPTPTSTACTSATCCSPTSCATSRSSCSTGHVYILETPLFRVRNKKETIYCYSEAERDAARREARGPRDHPLQGPRRDQPEGVQAVHRRRRSASCRVDAWARWARSSRRLDFFMGKNTPARKDFIIENLIADIA